MFNCIVQHSRNPFHEYIISNSTSVNIANGFTGGYMVVHYWGNWLIVTG